MAATDDSQIYRDLIRFKPEHLTANAWAVKAGVSRTVWADMRRHGNPSRRTLEKLLTAVGSSLAEFEALRIGPEPAPRVAVPEGLGDPGTQPWTPAQLPPIPLVRSGLAGEWYEAGSGIDLMELWSGELVDRLPRPASLGGDARAYALTIVGGGMWPRFRPGRAVAVSPRSPVAVGDDVLVRLRRLREGRDGGGEPALVGELLGKTSQFAELRQFKPDRAFEVDISDIEAIHKIAGELF
jgi:hypothetical protein